MQDGCADSRRDKVRMMDKITIKNAKFECNIGVTEKERRNKQKILIDAELFLNLKKASKTDSITNTINYSEIFKSIEKIASKKEFKLIEALAEGIAQEILSSYPIKKITVRVKKSLSYAEYAAVEITRKKNG